MGHKTELVYLDKDDKYMYFEVFHDNVLQGVTYMKRILPLQRKESANEGTTFDWTALREFTENFEEES